MWNQEQAVKVADLQPAAGQSLTTSQKAVDREGRIGASLLIKGDLSAAEDLTLDGAMEGTIQVPDHVLTVGADAVVRADVSARAVVIAGRVTGSVTARDKVEIRASGSVQGDVTGSRLVMADGARLQGRVNVVAAPETIAPSAAVVHGQADTSL